MAEFRVLPVEMVQKIFEMCSSIQDVVAFASTCRLANRAFRGPQKLRILETIANVQYGPIQDAINLVTYNETQNSTAQSTPSISLALLKQIDQVGRVANTWADLYPMEKWKWNYESRRLLTPYERYKVRRAIYRIWLYSNTFHSPNRIERPVLVSYDRGLYDRVWKSPMFKFLQKYTSKEAEEMMDMDSMINRLLGELCPHNGIISMRAKDQYPNQQLFFGDLALEPSATEYESWGDSITVNSIIATVQKLNPSQLLQFKDLKGKRERKEFLRAMDDEYEGMFSGSWSQLGGLLFVYLHLSMDSKEEVEDNGGIIAEDEDD